MHDTDSDVENYLHEFLEEGFGLQIPNIDCEHDAHVVKSLIKQAMDLIEDGFDYIGMFESIQFVIKNGPIIKEAFKDCPQTLIVLQDVAAVSEPLLDQQMSI